MAISLAIVGAGNLKMFGISKEMFQIGIPNKITYFATECLLWGLKNWMNFSIKILLKLMVGLDFRTLYKITQLQKWGRIAYFYLKWLNLNYQKKIFFTPTHFRNTLVKKTSQYFGNYYKMHKSYFFEFLDRAMYFYFNSSL